MTTHDNIGIIGKNVKDMYGTFMGKVVGTITDIDGSIQFVGIDCASQGLQQILYEQLVVQNDVVIFIPKWRLDSQRLIREKQLTLRRLEALIDIVSENDDMKADAEIVHEKYKAKLLSLEETQHKIKARFEERLAELDEQTKSAKILLFDARIQFKSDEITDKVFDIVKSCTNEIIEHVIHEATEISNVRDRIADLEQQTQKITSLLPQKNIQESAVSYLEISESQKAVQTMLPEAPTEPITPVGLEPIESKAADMTTTVTAEPNTEPETASIFPEPPQQMTQNTSKDDKDWLARMEAQ